MAHLAFLARRRLPMCPTLLSNTHSKATIRRIISRPSQQFHGNGASLLQTRRAMMRSMFEHGGLPGRKRALSTDPDPSHERTAEDRIRLEIRSYVFGLIAFAVIYEIQRVLYSDRVVPDAEVDVVAELHQDLADDEACSAASSYLDAETVVQLQRDIHAVLSADPAVMAEIGWNLKVKWPYYADLRPPYALMKFPCSGSRNRCTVQAFMRLPMPPAPYDHNILIEGFRGAVANQPEPRICDDIKSSETQRLMRTRSRFDLLCLDLSGTRICLYYNCTDAERAAYLRESGLQREPLQMKVEEKQTLEEIEVPATGAANGDEDPATTRSN